MNLQYLSNMQPVYEELKLINKKTIMENVVVEILGFILHNKKLNLYALEYDGKVDSNIPFHHLSSIEIDGEVFDVSGSRTGKLEPHNLKGLLLVNEFVRLGYYPSKAIETVVFSDIMLTELTIQGEFDAIPVRNNPKKIKLTQSERYKDYPVKKGLSLEINKNYPRAFKCGKDENSIPFYINKVYLMDLKTEMQKVFENPELVSKMSAQEFKKAKLEIDQHAKRLCPQGMRVPIIEYETKEASLQMHLKQYLDKPQLSNASSIGLIMSADTKTGKHGWHLRVTALEMVPEDTTEIDVVISAYWNIQSFFRLIY